MPCVTLPDRSVVEKTSGASWVRGFPILISLGAAGAGLALVGVALFSAQKVLFIGVLPLLIGGCLLPLAARTLRVEVTTEGISLTRRWLLGRGGRHWTYAREEIGGYRSETISTTATRSQVALFDPQGAMLVHLSFGPDVGTHEDIDLALSRFGYTRLELRGSRFSSGATIP